MADVESGWPFFVENPLTLTHRPLSIIGRILSPYPYDMSGTVYDTTRTYREFWQYFFGFSILVNFYKAPGAKNLSKQEWYRNKKSFGFESSRVHCFVGLFIVQINHSIFYKFGLHK